MQYIPFNAGHHGDVPASAKTFAAELHAALGRCEDRYAHDHDFKAARHKIEELVAWAFKALLEQPTPDITTCFQYAFRWAAWFDGDAPTVAERLQAAFDWWIEIGQGDDEFIALIKELKIKSADAFRQLLSPPASRVLHPRVSILEDVRAQQGLDLALLIFNEFEKLKAMADRLGQLLGALGLRAAARLTEEARLGFEAAITNYGNEPLTGSTADEQELADQYRMIIEEYSYCTGLVLDDCLGLATWETEVGLEQLGMIARAASLSWCPDWSKNQKLWVVDLVFDGIPLPDEVWEQIPLGAEPPDDPDAAADGDEEVGA
ncbi:hypothetical protein [Kitasatospora sp. NPDC050463]|uniref:hypothetical protein n=1 Tax=Kitasatospora sp. NPDC050463 TaxID=3155786 RepID=UPI0033FA16BE